MALSIVLAALSGCGTASFAEVASSQAVPGVTSAGTTPPAGTAPPTTAPPTTAPMTTMPGAAGVTPAWVTPPAPAQTFVVIGDSITAGLSPFNDAEVPGPTSWVPFAEGAPLAFDGGWASAGATTAAMRAGAAVSGADQLVLMGGTNDLLTGLDWTATRANLVDVVAIVGVPDVLLCAIPPLDQQPQARSEFNVRLAELAAEQGWDYVDPWTGVEAAGTFVAAASEDGVHPTPEVAAAVGDQIRGQLLLGMQG